MARLEFDQKARYRTSEQVLKAFDAIESVLEVVDQAKARHVAVFDPVGMQGSHPERYMREALGFLYGIYLEKFSELMSSLIQEMNRGHYLTVGLVGRSLLEAVALLRFYNNELADIARRAESPDAFSEGDLMKIVELLDQHSRGGRFDWQEFWTADPKSYAATLVDRGRKRFPNQPNPEQIRIGKAVGAWAADEPLVALAYDLFCELVHPNLGSSFLIMAYAEKGLAVGGDLPHGLGRTICDHAIKILYVAVHEIPKELGRAVWYWGSTRPDLAEGRA